LAFGPDCKFKDLKIFNYVQYREQKPSSNKSNIKSPATTSYANTTSVQPLSTAGQQTFSGDANLLTLFMTIQKLLRTTF
jgi:hypothetical protein